MARWPALAAPTRLEVLAGRLPPPTASTAVVLTPGMAVVPGPVVPVLTISVGIVGLLIAGNAVAAWPATIAARTAPSALLRAE